MLIDISDYKKSILDMFHELTEIEIKVHVDTLEENPKKYINMAATSIMAIKRCRKILEIILQEKIDDNVDS